MPALPGLDIPRCVPRFGKISIPRCFLKPKLIDIRKKQAEKQGPVQLLAKFEEEEMLAPFWLLTHADEGIAEDYSAYREAHRDKLIAFLDRYLVPPAP